MNPHPSAHRSSARPHGFTLIEILIVVTIIIMLLALAGPSVVSAIQGNRLSAAGQNMVSRMSQAQQMASSLNTPVEVRFYQFTDNTQVNPGNYFGAYQFILIHTKVDATNKTSPDSEYGEALSSPYFIESGIFITTATLSTTSGNGPASPLLSNSGGSMFTDGQNGPGNVSQQIHRGSSQAHYVAIRFLPSGEVKKVLPGSTDTSFGGTGQTALYKMQTLILNQAYLTLVGQKDMNGGTVVNYYAIQIDPYTGHVRSYQPTIATASGAHS